MVKKAGYSLASLLMVFALTIVYGVPNVHATDHISKDEAGKIVTDKYGGTVKNVEEESDGAIYEVEVEDSDDGRIEVDVDAAKGNGDILAIEYEDDNIDDESFIISEDEAEKAATDKYGGNVKETEMEHEDDSVLVYEVELSGSNKGDIEVDVRADNGEIYGGESEDDEEGNSENDNEKGNDQDNEQISKQEALNIVINKYGGKPDGELDDAVEEEDGGDTYEVEVIDSEKGNIEVDVDAYSGEILNVDVEESNNNSKEEGGQLPKTASNMPLGLLVGSLIVLSGGALWVISSFRRKKQVS